MSGGARAVRDAALWRTVVRRGRARGIASRRVCRVPLGTGARKGGARGLRRYRNHAGAVVIAGVPGRSARATDGGRGVATSGARRLVGQVRRRNYMAPVIWGP